MQEPGGLRDDRAHKLDSFLRHISFPGFQKEADSLLSVTKLSIVSDSQNMGKARDILLKLSEETNIFPTSWELSERYLFVVVSSSERTFLPTASISASDLR